MDAAEKSHWGEQDEYGNDLCWLKYNLTLTPEERIAQHQQALEFVKLCQEAARNAHAS